ncbi:helix-loop-helix DNA-binding domain-containing protein [Scheffersomyces xylosifermentans]|uniref:helix-loop-helix DNA-binding domain-containing protein n=1 Tax=Scheffersomyces xylosifermentans TaxID=1304137 RepID=UPI00315DAC68
MNQRDGSDLLNEVFFNINSAPLSPVASNEVEDQTWLNELLTKSAPITTSNSFSDLPNVPTYLMQKHSGQPIDFTKYFDNDSIFSTDEFGSSSETSVANSPKVKKEPIQDEKVTDFAALDQKLQQIRSINDCTPKSLESIFDTKDILKDENDVKNVIKSDANLVNNKQVHPMTDKPEVKKPAKRRRVPRKRLTDTQKQAHNKIEKKYRININAKIAGLQKIIPWVALERTAFETGKNESDDEDVNGNCSRLNKSMILEKATDYILYMQQNEKRIIEENRILKSELARLGGNFNNLST